MTTPETKLAKLSFEIGSDVLKSVAEQVCHKCAVRFEPMCAKALLFNTRADCFRAGLVVGKSLNRNGDRTRETLSDSPTLNQ